MARDGSTGRRTRRAPGDAEAGQTHEARGEASGDAGAGKARGAADVEAALDELYGTPPAAFVTRRTELAAAARQDGRADDARRIRAARRPTLAAWAANLLLRREPGRAAPSWSWARRCARPTAASTPTRSTRCPNSAAVSSPP
ncbi:hypothetical protein GCM10020256_72970 [Streptomyces thermocoprophilus]